MSCGTPKQLTAVLDKLKGVETAIGPVFKLLNSDPTALAWKAISATLGSGTLEGLKTGIISKVKGYLPDIDLSSLKVPGLQKDFTDLAKKITEAAIAGEDLKNEIDLLKQKYAGIDIKNLDLNNASNLIAQLKSDRDRLCKLLPNLQEDGAGGFILKGLPITFPDKSPEGAPEQATITETIIPQIQIDVERRVAEAKTRYVDIAAPILYKGV